MAPHCPKEKTVRLKDLRGLYDLGPFFLWLLKPLRPLKSLPLFLGASQPSLLSPLPLTPKRRSAPPVTCSHNPNLNPLFSWAAQNKLQ